MTLALPAQVRYILNTLENAGYEAYAVGGCVRDSLLGKTPKDWDICTAALPEQTMRCFAGLPVLPTGMRHGTITLILAHKPYEITTFRADGPYSDNRRPDTVTFVGALKADLSRRDFTINALAYHPRTGITDLFGGVNDLQNGVVACVGDAGHRFQEDALRILRALRLAAELGFTIERATARAVLGHRTRLRRVSAERIAAELNRLLLARHAQSVLREYIDVLTVFIPEIAPAIGFAQPHPCHDRDVLNHTLSGVANAPYDLVVRLTMLLHDLGKPRCYSETGGRGHFYGHAKVSADMARTILSRLRYDTQTIRSVAALVLYHDCPIDGAPHIKRWLNKIGEDLFRRLIEVKKADVNAQAAHGRPEKLAALNHLLVLTDEIIGRGQCFSRAHLAVNGKDLIAAGIPPGKMVGVVLNRLVDMVIDEQTVNDKAALLDAAKAFSRLPNGGISRRA